MHNEISDYLRMIDDADNAHSPTSRAAYADALIDVLRDIFTDEEIQALAQAKAEGRLVGCGIWERMINPFGELEGFMCECGHQSLAATNYCSNCGRKMHGGEAAEKALSPICNTTKLPCAGCNPVCEHRKGE
jgi:hypothetical protein